MARRFIGSADVEQGSQGDILVDSGEAGGNGMSDCDRYTTVCQDEFAEIHRKLDVLDEAIRGNGKPGIQLRLDRLEGSEKSRSRLLWLIAGSAVTLAASAAWRAMFGG